METASQDELLNQLSILNLSKFVTHQKDITDIGLKLEKEIGIDAIYALIATGKTVSAISSALGMSFKDLDLVLSRNEQLRSRLIRAKLHVRANKSVQLLEHFDNITSLEKEEAAALLHHRSIIAESLKLAEKDEDKNTGVTVINNINVASSDDIPDLPPELEAIEGEFEDVVIED